MRKKHLEWLYIESQLGRKAISVYLVGSNLIILTIVSKRALIVAFLKFNENNYKISLLSGNWVKKLDHYLENIIKVPKVSLVEFYIFKWSNKVEENIWSINYIYCLHAVHGRKLMSHSNFVPIISLVKL